MHHTVHLYFLAHAMVNRIVVALTVLVYDISLTMDQEVSTVWGSRWKAGKCLYLLVSIPSHYHGYQTFKIDGWTLDQIPVAYCVHD